MTFWQTFSESPGWTSLCLFLVGCLVLALASQVADLCKTLATRPRPGTAPPAAPVPDTVLDSAQVARVRQQDLAMRFALAAPAVPDWFMPTGAAPVAPAADQEAAALEYLRDNGDKPKSQWPPEVLDALDRRADYDAASEAYAAQQLDRAAAWRVRFGAATARRWAEAFGEQTN